MTGTDIRITQAHWPADEAAIRQVREQVFVVEQGVPAQLEWDGRDADCLHVLAAGPDGNAIGTGRLTPAGQIGRMAVLAPWRRRGVGSALLAELLAGALRQRMARVWLHAQVPAVDFYRRHGFMPHGAPFPEAGIPHQGMQRPLHSDLPAPEVGDG